MESKDFLEFVAGDSHNVAESGNYSIQVLEAALDKVSLSCSSVSSDALMKKELSDEEGFICNSSAHWFALRKVDGVWYNLNSLNKQGPNSVSDFYLSALLSHYKEKGHNIFLISGKFPYAKKLITKKGLEDYQQLILLEEIKPYTPAEYQASNQKSSSHSKKQITDGDYELDENEYQDSGVQHLTRQRMKQLDMEAVGREYVRPKYQDPLAEQYKDQDEYDSDYDGKEKSRKRKASKPLDSDSFEVSRTVQKKKSNSDNNNNNGNYENIEVTIWTSQNIRFTESFHPFMLVEDLYDFVRDKSKGTLKYFALYTNIPEKTFFNNKNSTLYQAGITDKSVLHVKRN